MTGLVNNAGLTAHVGELADTSVGVIRQVVEVNLLGALLCARRAAQIMSTNRGGPSGRLIGDGGWYFHVVDMAIFPAHQRRGVGNWVLTWLLDQVREAAPPDAFVSLMADPPGRRLYARHGFTERRDLSMGRAVWLHRDDSATSP